MIGPHWGGEAEIRRYMGGYYLTLGFAAGLVVGAVAASVVWYVFS